LTIAALTLSAKNSSCSPPSRAWWRCCARSATAAVCLALVAPSALLAIYIVAHGHLTPGGGFQGGVVLAGAFVFVYLAGRYRTFLLVTPTDATEAADAVGAAAFIVIGLIGFVTGAAFLQDVLPLGPVGHLYSAGTIPLINLAVGLEAGAGFLLILAEFLRQTLQVRAAAEALAEGDRPAGTQRDEAGPAKANYGEEEGEKRP
jgi:multicomponent Na+:H+ antiporter subunit B